MITHQGHVMPLRRRQYLLIVTMVWQPLQNQRCSSRIRHESVLQLSFLCKLFPFLAVLFRHPQMVFHVFLVVVYVLQSHFGKLVDGVGTPGHVGSGKRRIAVDSGDDWSIMRLVT